MKKCSICEREKPETEFTFDKQKKRLLSYCKPCRADKYRDFMREYYHTPKGRYKLLANQAKQRDLDFEISFEYVQKHWNDLCTYCGDLLVGLGLDRIDSSKGYTEDNVVPCCFTCNIMKSNLSLESFYAHLEKILSHREKTVL